MNSPTPSPQFTLSGAERTQLRGRGQTLDPAITLGKSGLTPQFHAEFQRVLNTHELIKMRLLETDRHVRAELCERIAIECQCECLGTVGRTALFYRPRKKESGS